MTKRLAIETVGCQMNVLDSELVVAALRREGWEVVTDPAQADAIFYNTCSVRQHAEDKIYSALGRVRLEKERRPGLVVGVLGCMAQKDQALIRARAPWVDLVVGPGQLHRVPRLVELVRAGAGPQLEVSLDRKAGSREEVVRSFESYDPDRDPSMRPTPFQAFVRTQTGCDKFCSFCVVPRVRGPEQARPPEAIEAEARRLVSEGCREITLIGQTVNSYRWKSGGHSTRLSDLLERLDGITGLDRIRFVTNYPRDMTGDLIAAVRDLPKVCHYLHVPAQHGADSVLSRMKRGYSIGEYMEMLARVREALPHAAVTSDFIVGFCGETDAEFQATLDLVRSAAFKNSFLFKYSPRPGTKAHERQADDIPESVKKDRHRQLLEAQEVVSLAGNRRFIGSRQQVLVEGLSVRDGKRGVSPTADGVAQLTGRTMCDRIVVFNAPLRLVGRLINVDITSSGPWSLSGEVADGLAEAVPLETPVLCGDATPVLHQLAPGRPATDPEGLGPSLP
jgi:tRNA-2-methylthio-N6-dimethylallyladenosine synthase